MIDPRLFRAPQDLSRSGALPRRVLMVGSCMSAVWAHVMQHGPDACPNDIFWIGTAPPQPPRPMEDYDFQIVQVPLRFCFPDSSFARLAQDDLAGHEKLFQHSCNAMRTHLETAMRWNAEHGILTFVFPFLPPQQNPMGRLMPRYDLRNMRYFVERLNAELEQELKRYRNAWLFDFNDTLDAHGRRFYQDDVMWVSGHASSLSDFDFERDKDRLEPAERASALVELRVNAIVQAGWAELLACWRTLRQHDQVKLVVTDLDDTFWRGVLAEMTEDDFPTTEGWPVGYWEALSFLKRRGVLLGILSKNEEGNVRAIWNKVTNRRIALEDFAITRINWRPKVENMAEMLAKVGLLPNSVVYIDDNPVERAAMQEAFPEMRVLGGTPANWRRLLLWSAETQVAQVTAESAQRTAMVQAQVERESSRERLSRVEFLARLDVRLTLIDVTGAGHPRFPRVLELINKTNQFNTTGWRWTHEELAGFLDAGGRVLAFEVTDAYTEYGLVGVLLLERRGINQFVMSCRVLGMEVEVAAVAAALERLASAGAQQVFAAMEETERNMPCRDIYRRCGFTPVPGGWERGMSPVLPLPAHVRVLEAAGA